MGQSIIKTAKLTFCAVAVAWLISPIPASAQFGGIFSGKSKENKTEVSVSPEDSTVSVEAEEGPVPVNTQEPENSGKEAATSFATLCNNGQGKSDGTEVKKRRGIFGMADRMSALTRKIPLVGDFMVDSANSLSQTIACKLYPEEQKQAAEATEEATRSAEIGKKVEWKSTVRENVSGSSTVSAKNQLSNGTPCLVISDIVIIDGEETQVSKKMCRLAGSPRYTMMAA